jgi:hypothetical protein
MRMVSTVANFRKCRLLNNGGFPLITSAAAGAFFSRF